MNRVVHFEIHASEPERAAKFYSDVFGWEIKEWVLPGVKDENRYWVVMTDSASSPQAPSASSPQAGKENGAEDKWPGINGGMIIRKGPEPKGGEPVNAYVCTIDVSDCDEYVKKIEAAGGKIAVPKMDMSNVGFLAYGVDTEGNIFGIMQDTSKK